MMRVVCIFCILLLFLLHNADAARYQNYAAIAISASDGEVLYAQNPDKTIHLASITKLMTLYLAFEAIQADRVSLDDKITISRLAASQIEKKVHLKPGNKYTLRELVLATAVFSANDAAFAIAEEIAGSAEDFVYLMNQKAAELGLDHTRYGNPAGTPDAKNYSTPKDVIYLAQKLRQDFPQYYSIFSMEMFGLGGKIYGNGNGLLSYFKGVDGLKTGYINLSGYNLVCSFKYKDSVIVAAVFGLSSKEEREKHMREIMDYSVKKVLHRKMVKSDAGDGMVFEYENFLKNNDIVPTSSSSMHLQILRNIIERGKLTSPVLELDRKSFSPVDKALSEVSSFADILSHPLPMIGED